MRYAPLFLYTNISCDVGSMHLFLVKQKIQGIKNQENKKNVPYSENSDNNKLRNSFG